LANAYLSMQPDMPHFFCETIRPQVTAGALVNRRSPAGALGTSQILWPSDGTTRALDVQPSVQTELVIPSLYGIAAARRPDGQLIAVANDALSGCHGDAWSPNLARQLVSHVWVSAAEPNVLIGTAPSPIEVDAVALSFDGTLVQDTASVFDGQMLL